MKNELIPMAVSEELAASHTTQDEMLNRIGQMTRNLHDNLRGLGFDKLLEKAASEIPDARDRLAYVARMTEQAAERVLNAIDKAQPLQANIANGATALEQQWQSVLAVPSYKRDYDKVANATLEFLADTGKNTTDTKDLLMEIMMAQDFQDLTGQVIKKITELAHGLEQQLVQILIDYTPSSVKKESDNSLLNGPQINPEQSSDAVANQEQVDDLLESLGF
ncbi:MAG TPA: protein phosphatase CheZ [Methylophilaceae bacterium]|nr:protein phosphatase CheZ [Methylophilaceae bacterium]